MSAYLIWFQMRGHANHQIETIQVPVIGANIKTYESPDHAFRFSYPATLSINSISSKVVNTGIPDPSTTTINYPDGSIEVPGLAIISHILYSSISKVNPIYNYTSCCSGARYWFDSAANKWNASNIQTGSVGTDGQFIPDPEAHMSLAANGECSLKRKYGSTVFYKIVSGDEGAPTDIYYFVPTNKGYLIRFLFDIDPDTINSQKAIDIKSTLQSLTLGSDVTEISADCN